MESGIMPGPDILLFLQNLTIPGLNEIESLIEQTILSSIKKDDLFYLFPISLSGNGPVRKEMVKRMPIRLWLSESFYTMPVHSFWDHDLPTMIEQKEDFLTWCFVVGLLKDALFIKIIWDRALARALARDRIRGGHIG